MMRKVFIFITGFLFLSSFTAYGAVYKIDAAHTHIGFSVKHLVISNVMGKFKNISGSFELDGKDNIRKAVLDIKTASIDTAIEKRDNHLKSADFFDAQKYPSITFTYKDTLSRSGNKFKVSGDLTIKNVTREVILDMEMLGKVKDPWGFYRAGFTGRGKIDRKDFGIVYNQVLEAGGLLIGNTVNIILEFEGILKK